MIYIVYVKMQSFLKHFTPKQHTYRGERWFYLSSEDIQGEPIETADNSLLDI